MAKVNNNKYNSDTDQLIISGNKLFWVNKRFFDILISIILLPLLIILTVIISFVNLVFNKGQIFFIQKRMGKNCVPFNAIKFRTMKSIDVSPRNHSDPLEIDRITTFGSFLRKVRIDELPQIINVIKGDMSLIGPRPDCYDHALHFLETIPDYHARHAIKPGISGLSQIRLGYAEGLEATKKKSKVDIFYIKNVSFFLDTKIFIGTLLTVLKGLGN